MKNAILLWTKVKYYRKLQGKNQNLLNYVNLGVLKMSWWFLNDFSKIPVKNIERTQIQASYLKNLRIEEKTKCGEFYGECHVGFCDEFYVEFCGEFPSSGGKKIELTFCNLNFIEKFWFFTHVMQCYTFFECSPSCGGEEEKGWLTSFGFNKTPAVKTKFRK